MLVPIGERDSGDRRGKRPYPGSFDPLSQRADSPDFQPSLSSDHTAATCIPHDVPFSLFRSAGVRTLPMRPKVESTRIFVTSSSWPRV